MIYKFICFSLADTQNSEFKGDPRHKGEIILGFGNGSVRTKAAIWGIPDFDRIRLAADK
jgi:steroid 5-alpha reductase family enzyme